MTNKFINPWKDLPKEKKTRTTIDVSDEAISKIQSVKPGPILQTTINILLFKLVETLLAHGYTTFNPDGFEHAVANCTIVFPDGSTTGVAPAGKRKVRAAKTVSGND
jgi:hypothetical protein